jgi:hypothetical protein
MGHKLHHLLNHDLDKLIPTLIIGDFNTHTIWWSLSECALSAWADDFTEWLDTNNLSILNLPGIPTWQGSREGDCPSILDLAIANTAVTQDSHVSEATVSFVDPLSSDHAVLTIYVYPSVSLTYLPQPHLAGYQANNKLHNSWIKAFHLEILSLTWLLAKLSKPLGNRPLSPYTKQIRICFHS